MQIIVPNLHEIDRCNVPDKQYQQKHFYYIVEWLAFPQYLEIGRCNVPGKQ